MVNLNQFVKQAETMQKKCRKCKSIWLVKIMKEYLVEVSIKINRRGECLMVSIDKSLIKKKKKRF